MQTLCILVVGSQTYDTGVWPSDGAAAAVAGVHIDLHAAIKRYELDVIQRFGDCTTDGSSAGDVVGGLPVELSKRGHKVMSISPR